MDILTGEIYGKQSGSRFVMYNVLKVSKNVITLQNIDNPLSLFETTPVKLQSAGYVRISQTPYINTASTGKKRKSIRKPSRCPYTLDFLEDRADSQRPAPIVPDLFSQAS
ncbi:hypothetical protein [Methylobacillus caricis]|uniref:hypothetical protein n=1 Tax=Methylobacillus caricis TaxID=1971611 RepID=UPI00384B6301